VRVRIKFCGMTREADVDAAVRCGADALGFNLATGPRRIEVERARDLVRRVPPFVQTVALFVDADEATICAAMAATRCHVVQLHGDEPPELVAALARRFPVVQALRIAGAGDLEAIDESPADAVLLDAEVAGLRGGSGESWDHGLLAGRRVGKPWILAGGLDPENVAAAIAATGALAVATASGIEEAPGCKSAAKMDAFAAAVAGS